MSSAAIQVSDDVWSAVKVMPKVGFLTVERSYYPAMCFKTPAYPIWVTHGMKVFHSHTQPITSLPFDQVGATTLCCGATSRTS
jgi:hypothetical protein